MAHYFTNDHVKSEQFLFEKEICQTRFSFYSDNGVFSKETIDYGTLVLIEQVAKENITGSLMDIGCGIGVIAIALEKLCHVKAYGVDVNERAVALANQNAKQNHTDATFIVNDGLSNINETFRTIVTNPPIRTGKKVIYRLFQEAYNHLEKGGVLYIVIRKQHGAQSALNYLSSILFQTEILHKEKGYWIIKATK